MSGYLLEYFHDFKYFIPQAIILLSQNKQTLRRFFGLLYNVGTKYLDNIQSRSEASSVSTYIF